jgi:hypothetical protein
MTSMHSRIVSSFSTSSLDRIRVMGMGSRPGLQTVIDCALQQSLIPRKIDVEEFFDDTARA